MLSAISTQLGKLNHSIMQETMAIPGKQYQFFEIVRQVTD